MLARHKDAHSNTCAWAFNIKDLRHPGPKTGGSCRLFLPARVESDSLPAEEFLMDHRLFAVLAIICFALGGAGRPGQEIEEKEGEGIEAHDPQTYAHA
jgi:hypothetical protein